MDYLQEAATLATARDFLRWAATCMNKADLHHGHGSADAVDEATTLLLHVIHQPYPLSADLLDARLTTREQREFVELLVRRIVERVPLAFLINEAWFAGRPYYVDSRVLVPRSPLAELIEKRFLPWIDSTAPPARILDLCAGSGCIGIACAHFFPDAQVDLGELDVGAVEVAEINVLAHEVEDRVAVFESDLFQAFAGQAYDLIVSNPPYVSGTEHELLPVEYRHEPEFGLVAGAEGLDVVARILGDAAAQLSASGLLIVEVGATWPAVVHRWPDVPFIWLTFARGGEGVFLLTREQLCRHAKALAV